MINQSAYAAACDERSYGEPTCKHSDEQNTGGECEACYVKRTASPAMPRLISEQELNDAKTQINKDIADGTIPESVRSFSVLHDYVDANEYLAAVWTLDNVDRANALSDALDLWLSQGRP